MIKKMICIAMAAAMLSSVGVCSITAGAQSISSVTQSAESILEEDGFKFYYNYEGRAVITKYTGTEEKLDIPGYLGGANVGEIAENAFEDCKTLKKVTIPGTVTSIGNFAFAGCTNLTDVEIPAYVKFIGELAFFALDEQGDAYWPIEGLTIHGYNHSAAKEYAEENNFAFDNKDNKDWDKIYDYAIGENGNVIILRYKAKAPDVLVPGWIYGRRVTAIYDAAFKNCTELETVGIPESVMYIGDEAFYGCKNLTFVSIPKSVQYVGDLSFMLMNVEGGIYEAAPDVSVLCYYQSAAHLYCEENEIPYVLEDPPVIDNAYKNFTFVENANGTIIILRYIGTEKYVTIPKEIDGKRVTAIADGAFKNRSDLGGVTIPDSVTSIGDYAFYGCYNMKYADVPRTVQTIGEFAFCYDRVGSLEALPYLVITGYGDTAAQEYADENNIPFLNYDLPDSIGPFSFTISDGRAAIDGYTGEDALWEDGSHIEIVNIPAEILNRKVTRIYGYVFKDQEYIKEVNIPENVEELGVGVFYNCQSLESVTIPRSVTSIGEDTFAYIPEGEEEIKPLPNVTVHGYEGSYAQTYCEENGIKFEAIEETPEPDPVPDPNPDPNPVPDPVKKYFGDIDNDGQITSYDALCIIRASVGLDDVSDEFKLVADVDGDGEITTNDALAVLRTSVDLKSDTKAGQEIV